MNSPLKTDIQRGITAVLLTTGLAIMQASAAVQPTEMAIQNTPHLQSIDLDRLHR